MTRDLQIKIDEAYPRYYDYRVDISKEKWIKLLNNSELFEEVNLEYLRCLYTFENHAATNKEISVKLGTSNTADYYSGKANALNRRIAQKLGIEDIPAKDGSNSKIYWYVLYYGRSIKSSEKNRSGVFEWKLRPELAEALKELYPDLDYPKPTVKKNNHAPTAVWLATAILAYNRYYSEKNLKKEHMYFKQTEIKKTAEKICEKDINQAIISSLYNANHKTSTYNYLHEDRDASIRLSYFHEFNGKKEQPDLILHDLVNTEFGIKTVKEIKEFVENNYTKLFKEEVIDINYISILDYLEKYADEKYVNPDKAMKNKNHYLEIKKSGQYAVKELDKIAELCKKQSELKSYGLSKWLTGGNDVVRGYLWRELKYEGYMEIPTSISIVAEIVGGEARFKLSVELNDAKSEPKDYTNHHRILDKDIKTAKDKLVYLTDENSLKNILLNEPTAKVKQDVKSGKHKKVKIARIITRKEIENKNNEEIKNEMLKALAALIPFYELAIGVNNNPQLRKDKNMILFGPPGTGKTYHTISYAVSIIENTTLNSIQQENYNDVFKRYNAYKETGQIAFTTFHQSYGYEEFIESIRPVINEGNNERESSIQYEYSPGIFKEFCTQAEKNLSQIKEIPYVFIIDEINRGNISKIFGELITLIEDTKRIGEEEETKTILPYTGDEFGVPKNIYLIGTMNTADRSIALMDTALRRRFNFIEMMPDVEVLNKLKIPEIEGIDIPRMLQAMNNRIEYLYDREHTIGHSYFTSLNNNSTLDDIANIFLKSIIPLLQEYFYEDYEKIQLVLGDNSKNVENKLVLDIDNNVNEIFKSHPDIDMNEQKYIIQKDAFYISKSYKEIY